MTSIETPPSPRHQPPHLDIRDLAPEAIAKVHEWLDASRSIPVDDAARTLAGVLSDPDGLRFAVGFVDGVVRPEDVRVAARNLRELTDVIPAFLPAPLRGVIRLGAWAGRFAPWIVVPAARVVLRRMVQHLLVDARPRGLDQRLRRLRRDDDSGIRLNINLLGEAILGEREAARRLQGTRALLERDDVDYVSIKVSSTVAPHSAWSFDDAVSHAVDALTPLYRIAAASSKFINLDMEEYKDLDLTIATFISILDRPEFRDLEAGIVLQAYLPDALGAMMRLQEWAAGRVADGCAPVKVRVVKGANLPMEQVDAEVHGWPMATWGSKQESDSSYKAVLDYALHPERVRNVRIGVAGHNLFDIALAWLLATRRGVTDGVDVEMLLGMAAAQAEVVRRDVGSLLLYTPLVHPREFDVAIAYLIRRLEEGASSENFMSAVFDLATDETAFTRERDRFLASLDALPAAVPAPARRQDRTCDPITSPSGFANTPDTDPSIAANRAWAAGIRDRMADSTLGDDTVRDNTLGDSAALAAVIETGVAAGTAWRELGAAARARILHRAGEMLERRRPELLEVMGSEDGKTLDQGDAEVSEAIDFAHYYAERGLDLENVDGASFVPVPLTVVTPPWNFPVAIPAGSALAALAAGSPVIIKPARQARRAGAVMVEALWEAGVPRDVLQYVQLDGRDLGRELVAHPSVGRVILTGAFETAEMFRGFRNDLPLLAETSGKNAMIVTPSADLDLAVRDLVASAFGHAGQKCSASSLVILVGSVARSERFRRQLVDAVTSLRVGVPWDEAAQVGPLIGPAEGKLLRGLTTLGAGESWLVRPEKLDASGAQWRPGIRVGVQPGSEYHRTEYFGPILGVMTADTLEQAIEWVNDIDFGLTSGLHSLDDAEVQTWMRTVQAGNAYVNRGTTGAIVQRQPFGGWKKSAVGPGAKAGGPNYLMGLGDWVDRAPAARAADAGDGPARDADLLTVAAGHLPDADVAWLRAALATDAAVWQDEFGRVRDVTGLTFEQNAFRYGPVPVTIRHESDRPVELIRVVAAGRRAAGAVSVSTAEQLPGWVARLLARAEVIPVVEDRDAWYARARELARLGGRTRLIGGDATELATAIGGAPGLAVFAGPVVSAGRVEALTFLREQSVSIASHRFGAPRRTEIPALIGGVADRPEA
ncbi:proline dehydrogenase family protein [Microbacterium sp.]|uniref:proline dehydrogenase family protein n=1 Tax=Microbacterium sp. TaxID=51671 RepID=UPI003A846B3B